MTYSEAKFFAVSIFSNDNHLMNMINEFGKMWKEMVAAKVKAV